MSPEDAAGRFLTPASDQFPLGLALYRMLAGESVYRHAPGVDARSAESIFAHLERLAESGGELGFDFPEPVLGSVRAVIERATRIRPQDRFRDAAEMRSALQVALQGAPVALAPDFDPQSVRQIGRFAVRRLVAEGLFGWLFDAEDPELFGARRALVLSRPGRVDTERFSLEARALVSIRHPNLVPVHDFGRDEASGLDFYTMEFMEGGTLADVRTSWQVESDPVRLGTVLSLAQMDSSF